MTSCPPSFKQVFYLWNNSWVNNFNIYIYDSIFKCMHQHTLFCILFKDTHEVHQAHLFSWLDPKAKTWFTSSQNIPIFHLPLAIFCTNNILNLIMASPSINGKSSSLCVYTFHQFTCKHPLVTMCTWQWTYEDTWCCARCHCINHCSKNQFSSCIWTISHV